MSICDSNASSLCLMSINPHFKGHEAVNEKFLWDEIMLMDQTPHHNVPYCWANITMWRKHAKSATMHVTQMSFGWTMQCTCAISNLFMYLWYGYTLGLDKTCERCLTMFYHIWRCGHLFLIESAFHISTRIFANQEFICTSCLDLISDLNNVSIDC